MISYRNLRQVSPDEGKDLAAENQAAWIETSAKNNLNVGKLLSIPAVCPDPDAAIAKVFELCLGEIEKQTPSSKTEPPASKCVCM